MLSLSLLGGHFLCLYLPREITNNSCLSLMLPFILVLPLILITTSPLQVSPLSSEQAVRLGEVLAGRHVPLSWCFCQQASLKVVTKHQKEFLEGTRTE